MVKQPGATHYEPITWEEAFQLMARELNALPTPNAAAFYTSGRASNEAAVFIPAFCAAIRHEQSAGLLEHVHESSGGRAQRSHRIGKGCVTLDDFEHADGISSWDKIRGRIIPA